MCSFRRNKKALLVEKVLEFSKMGSCIEFIIKNSVLELSIKIRDKFLDIYKSTFKIKRTRVVDSACDYSLQTWKRHGYIRKYQSTVIREYASTNWLCRAKKRFSLANACKPGPTLVGRPCCRPRRVEPHLWGEGILCIKSRSKISIQLNWDYHLKWWKLNQKIV